MGLLDEIRSLIARPTRSRRATHDDAAAVQSAETALQRLSAERANVTTALRDLHQRRRALLLQDGTDTEIAAIEAELDTLNRTLERLELLEPELMTGLQDARGAQRRGHLRRLVKASGDPIRRMAAGIRATQQAKDEVVRLREEADRLGLGNDFRHVIDYPPWAFGDLAALFDAYEATMERRAEAFFRAPATPVAAQPVPRPVAVAPSPAAVASSPTPARNAPSVASAHSPVQPAEPPVRPSLRPAKTPAVRKEGEVAVVVIRTGFEGPDGRQYDSGETAFMSPEAADDAMRRGAVDLLPEGAA
jgi:hypothetical protein